MPNAFSLDEYIDINKPSWENHSDVIFVKDRTLRYVYVNPTFLLGSNYTEDQIIGHTNYEFHPNEIADNYRLSDLHLLQTKKPVVEERAMTNHFGEKINYLITKTPILDRNGEIIGIHGSARSIDRQTQIREELQLNLNLVETLLNTIHYPIFVKNIEGQYIRVNKAYAKDLGISVDEILGRDDIDLFGEELGNYYKSKDRKVFKTEQRDTYISKGVRDDFKYVTSKDVLRNSNGDVVGLVGIVSTLSELNILNQDLIKEARIDTVTQIAAGLAHDLNNILTNITAQTSLMMFKADADTLQDLETINNAAMKASELIEKLRTFSGKEPDIEEDIYLNDLVKEIIRIVSGKYGKKYKFVTNFDSALSTIVGDKSKISQVILNLIINGLESMNEGNSLVIRTEQVILDENTRNFVIIPDNFTGGKYVSLSIKDNGHGIKPQIISKIFEPYFTTKSDHGGSGLGLSIVYGITNTHNGLLSVDTELGKGTTFTIYFPVKS